VVERLPYHVDFVLEAHALLAVGFVGCAAVVFHFGAEFGASGFEEVGFLRNWELG